MKVSDLLNEASTEIKSKSDTAEVFKRNSHTGRLNGKPEDSKPTGRYAARLARYAKEREERENKKVANEGWKDNLAAAAVVGGLAVAGGSLIGAQKAINSNTIHIDGKEFYKKSEPEDKSEAKIKTDDKGNKFYTWSTTAGNKTHYWYSPVNKK